MKNTVPSKAETASPVAVVQDFLGPKTGSTVIRKILLLVFPSVKKFRTKAF
jgi:hypothetical protein